MRAGASKGRSRRRAPRRAARLRASRLVLDEAVPHAAKTLDLGLHDVADLEERIRALADPAAGAAEENIAGFQRHDARGELDLLFRRVDELRGVAVLLGLAVDREMDAELHVVRHEGARHQEGPHRREIVVALAAEPV